MRTGNKSPRAFSLPEEDIKESTSVPRGEQLSSHKIRVSIQTI